jgi:hypothetical protein
VLKNSLVPSSDPCSGAQNPGSVVFWPRLLGVLDLFCTADPADSDFFNSLGCSRKFAVTKSVALRRIRGATISLGAGSPLRALDIGTPVTAKCGKPLRLDTCELPENFSLPRPMKPV